MFEFCGADAGGDSGQSEGVLTGVNLADMISPFQRNS